VNDFVKFAFRWWVAKYAQNTSQGRTGAKVENAKGKIACH